jgi:predicted nucleic acid-binding protein
MASKVFVNTNVFLDQLLQRGEAWRPTEALFSLAEQRQLILYTSSSILTTIIYFLEINRAPATKVRKAIRLLLTFVQLAETKDSIILQATHSEFKDLEDAIQYYTAMQIKGIEYFITSNLKDFKKALPQLPVLSPQQFIDLH